MLANLNVLLGVFFSNFIEFFYKFHVSRMFNNCFFEVSDSLFVEPICNIYLCLCEYFLFWIYVFI